MGLLHSAIPDSELHEAKGFAGAANNTILTKNGSGVNQWQGINAIVNSVIGFETGTITGTPTTITATSCIGKTSAVLWVDNIMKGIWLSSGNLNNTTGVLSSITGLEADQIWLIISA